LVEGPDHVEGDRDAPPTGWYEVEFMTPEGSSVTRLCTDKGRAEVLRRTDAGQRAFTREEMTSMTVPDDLSTLLQRTVEESGEGA
jgi:hypothetical protein